MPCSCGESKCSCSERCFCPAKVCFCISCLYITKNETLKTESDTAPFECNKINYGTFQKLDDLPERKGNVSPSKNGREYTEVLGEQRQGFGEDIKHTASDNSKTETESHNAPFQDMSLSESDDCEIICVKIDSSWNGERSTKQEDDLKRKFDSIGSVPNVPTKDGLLFQPSDTNYSQRKRRKRSRKKRKSVMHNIQEIGKDINIWQSKQIPHLTFRQHTDLTASDNAHMQTDRHSSKLSIPASSESSSTKLQLSTPKPVADIVEDEKEKDVSKIFKFSGRFLQDIQSSRMHVYEASEIARTSPVLSNLTTDSEFPETSLGVYPSPECSNSVHSSYKNQTNLENKPDVSSIQNTGFNVSDNNDIVNRYSSVLSMSHYEISEFPNDCEAVSEKKNIRKRRRFRKGNRKKEEAGLENVLQNDTNALSKPPRRWRRRRKKVHCKMETFRGSSNTQNGGVRKTIKKERGFVKKEIKREKCFVKKEIKRENGFIKKKIKTERP